MTREPTFLLEYLTSPDLEGGEGGGGEGEGGEGGG